MKKIHIWLRVWKAMWTWIGMCRILIKEIDKLPSDSDARIEALVQLRNVQAMIGSNVLRLFGVYPLEDGWDFDET